MSALPAKLSHHGAVARKHLVKAGDKQSAEAYGEPRLATAELVGGACFWGLMYWLFFKAVAHITKLVQAIPELEIGSFLALSLIPLLLVRKGAVRCGVDKPLDTLARYMPSFGLRHVVRSAVPGAHNLMTALLLFFAVNLLVAAVPESVHFELPEHLKVLDPDHNGILTGTELGIVVRTLSIKLLRVLCYLETGLFALTAIAKPKTHKATSNDVIDQYWRNVDRKVMKPVIISILLHAVILLYTASGVLRTLGLAPRSILALGGVSGLAFGLAAQNLVGNFMSGLLLVLNRQFTVGDYIETNGIQGKVLAMGWTFIEIQRGEDLVMLPNSQVIGTTVVQIGRLADPGGDDASESTNA